MKIQDGIVVLLRGIYVRKTEEKFYFEKNIFLDLTQAQKRPTWLKIDEKHKNCQLYTTKHHLMQLESPILLFVWSN